MLSAWQPALFGGGPAHIDPQFGGIERLDLRRGAWLDHLPCWLEGHNEIFETLRETVAWRTSSRWMYERRVAVPRLLGDPPAVLPPVLTEMQQALEARYEVPFDRLSFALYRDGNDSVAWHADQILRERQADSHVCTVAVGERRDFTMREVHGSRTLKLTTGWGDLLVMGGSCQRTWQHRVPKVRRAGPRLVMMWRSSAEGFRG